MASEQFRSEYIEYLQNRNAELLNRLSKMREIYENKIFSKNLNQHYFNSTLLDVLNICTVIPEEIDTLFDKMSEAMSVLINVLSRKSTLIKLGEKVSKLLSPPENEDLIDAQSSEENNNSKTGKKGGTVKVSPMINGHIISTEPRIYLSRVSGNYIPNRRSDDHRLSPILEVSPDIMSNSPNKHNFRELRVTSQRLNLVHSTYDYINQESPKGRFKGTKIWKKSLSSNRQAQNKKDTLFSQNNENTEKLDVEATGLPQSSGIDPMEGPSWLYDEDQQKNESSPKCYIDFRRRRNRYARIFEKDENDITYFKNEELTSDKEYEDIPNGEPCNEFENHEVDDMKNLSGDSSGLLIETDEEHSPRTDKPSRLKKRKSLGNDENYDNSAQKKKPSHRFTNKEREDDSVTSDSSYEGDNEENYSKKCGSNRISYVHNRSKSLFESESIKSLTPEASGESEFNCQETLNSPTGNRESLKSMPYDIKSLIKDALGKEVRVRIDDCIKKRETLVKEKFNQESSNASKSKSKSKSFATDLSNDKKIIVVDIEKNSNGQSQRSKRKAAPTNLTEPKLSTKLRRA